MGSSLTGVLYVLDEPSIGLHPKDCGRLLESLSDIKDAGNTIIIVEHDEETINWADHIVDMGPGAGTKGGWVVAEGSPLEIRNNVQVSHRSIFERGPRYFNPGQKKKNKGFYYHNRRRRTQSQRMLTSRYLLNCLHALPVFQARGKAR